MHTTSLASRGIATLAACGAVAAAGWRLAAQPVADVLGPVVDRGPGAVQTLGFDTLVVGLAALLLVGCAGWLVLATAVATAVEVARDLAPGARVVGVLDRVVDRWSPVLVRRLVAAVVGTAVTAGLAAGPALAAPGHGHGLGGLALPDRTTGAGPAHAPAPHAAAAAGTGTGTMSRSRSRVVVVRAGDCLWSIAADLLPVTASDRDVMAAWHRLHAANRDRIGPDPDVILPGTRLRVPDLSQH